MGVEVVDALFGVGVPVVEAVGGGMTLMLSSVDRFED
jgi:hypothetical protein